MTETRTSSTSEAAGSNVKPEPMTYWSTTERGRKAEDRLVEFPYDTEAWGVLVREAQLYPMEAARGMYERIVKQFPTAGRYWKTYIEQEMKNKNLEHVEKLFQRCLMKVLHIDLWKCYLAYVKETKQNLPNFREKMIQAYEFAVDKVGLDYHSYPIWHEYIQFLKAGDSVGAYAENQKILSIRKVYIRAVVTPMTSIDSLWKEYNTFEQGINKHLAEKLIHDKTRDFLNARRASKEYQQVTNGIVRGNPPVPPQATTFELKQKEIWRRYIGWEKQNPLRTDDTAVVTKRVTFAYEQCLLCLGHHPDIWYEGSLFLEGQSKKLMERGDMQGGQKLADEAAAFYERATTTLLKKSLLLHFAYADYEESRKRFQKVHDIYQRILKSEDVDVTLIYIQYMKFSRRAEGIKESRLIFRKGREDTRSNYNIFIAAALLEHFCNKDSKVAHNIFELGMKKYNNLQEYVLAYLDYKIHLNEDNNTRVLFERVLTSMATDKAREVMTKYLEFESQYGDLSSILKIDRRISLTYEDYPDNHESIPLVDRYRYMGLLPATNSELKSINYTVQGPTRSVNYAAPSSSIPEKNKKIADLEDEKEFVKPDVNQMRPFRPIPIGARSYGPQVAPGGVFPPPPAAMDLMAKLPPPDSFHGPFVMVDDLLEFMVNCKLEEPSKTNGQSLNDSMETETERRGTKRAINSLDSNTGDSDDESMGIVPPVNDIYRRRQQKRVQVF